MGTPLHRRIRNKLFGRAPRMAVPLEEMPAGTIGRHTYGGGVTVHHFTVNGGLKVGAYCSFAAEVEILLGGNHRHDWVTTYPFPNRDARFAHLPPSAATRGDIVIGNDVWVGRGATILSGVKIGDGAVIAARAVVSRDVEPYAIVGGNPAKFIRHRFPAEQIATLQRIAWWDWPEDRVDRAVPMLLQDDIDAFIRAVDAGEL
ncbi:MAG TPA: CatB-related O-acetyltransferase [Sphingomonas sp.]|nr:CatB-related O-acetyltransferase [Sphingomonas sp.]